MVIIFDKARQKENLEKYHKENNASFVAEVEEYAKWAEAMFREYCEIVGTKNAIEESKNNNAYPLAKEIDFIDCRNGFLMPKITVNRRNDLSRKFREIFDKYQNVAAIEKIAKRHKLPANSTLPINCIGNSNIRGPCSISLYQIIFLKVYISIKQNGYNLGKAEIEESEVEEFQKIQNNILPRYPWLKGKFSRH